MATKKKQVRPITKAAAEEAIAGTLHNLSTDFLQCRDLRHSWGVFSNFIDAQDMVAEPGRHVTRTVQRTLRCMTCGTTRFDYYALIERPNSVPRMEKVSTSYKYPKGYQMQPGSSTRDMAVSQLVRYETLRRVLAATKKAS